MLKDEKLPHVVLVDDDEDDRFMMREALADSGCRYNLIEFGNGPEFLNYLGRESLQADAVTASWLVILDMHLPCMNGLEVLQRMQQNGLGKHIPVFVMTGNSNPDLVKQAVELGAKQCIGKPSCIEDLINHIKTTFGLTPSR